MNVLELTGSPRQRGRCHGEALKELICEFADSITEVHQQNNNYLTVATPSLKDFCYRNLGFMKKYARELVDEMEGIAEGAGVKFSDILLLNAFLELEDLRAPALGGKILPDSLWGCTTFNIPAEISANGKAFIGQTYDMEKYYQKFLVLQKITNAHGPDALVVSLAGIIGLNGMNSVGIGSVINKITATDARPGVIYPFVMRKILASQRIGDALGAAIFSPRASGINYQLCGSGLAFCAETSATRYELLDCRSGIAHTNHYVGSKMAGFETANWLSHGGSMVRKEVADSLISRNKGKITPAMLQRWMQDHTNYPRSICAHGFPEENEKTAFHTIFALVMAPEEGWLEICPGNPCENIFSRYSLRA